MSTAESETANEASTITEPAQSVASSIRQRIQADRQQTPVTPQAQTHQPAQLPSQAPQNTRSENKFVLLIIRYDICDATCQNQALLAKMRF